MTDGHGRHPKEDPAGNLKLELAEIAKLNFDDQTPYGSWTRMCMAFLTIICC